MVRFQKPENNLSQENEPKREGPFPITDVLEPVTYRLKLPASWQIHDVFHARLLQPYKENKVYGKNFTEPPPNLVKGEEVYEVETILNYRKEDEDTNTLSNGGDILSPMQHGNWNIHFLTMVTP